ncbi:hypothetical protein ACXR2T_13150 [Leucobacter sp. HY1910]
MNVHGILMTFGLLLISPAVTPYATATAVSGAEVAATAAKSIDPSESETVTRGEHLTLTSIGDTVKMRTMQPGVPVHWQVGVAVNSSTAGSVQVSAAAQGSVDLGLMLEFQTCSVRWHAATCAGQERSINQTAAVSTDGTYAPLFEMREHELEEWLLVTATIPEDAAGTASLTVRATGQGEVVTAGPGDVAALARTGIATQWPTILSVSAVGAGLAAAGIAHAHRKTHRHRSAA